MKQELPKNIDADILKAISQNTALLSQIGEIWKVMAQELEKAQNRIAELEKGV